VTLRTRQVSKELFPVLEVSAKSSLGEIGGEVLQLPFGKFRLRGLSVRRQIISNIVDDYHNAGHAPPVPWESANVRILSKLCRGRESQLDLLARRSQFRSVKNFW